MNDFVINDNVLVYYNGKEKHVIIPDTVTTIGGSAFNFRENIISVIIPDSVTCISDYAFYGCSGLKSVTIPNSVKSIGDCAFRGCIGLKSVTIGDSVTSIDRSVFEGCSGLRSITVSDSITSVCVRAFYKCQTTKKTKKNIAYKGFNKDMTCRRFQYEEGKTYTCDEAELCKCGFHACLNPLDCFNYYYGKNVVYHEVILEERTNEKQFDSKICGKKITIGRRLTIKEMFDIYNELNK